MQDGVLSLEQALGHGLGRNSVQRLVGEGRWHRLAPGVLLASATPAAFPALCWAGVLLGGDGARIGGAAAAHLHGWLDQPPDQIDVWSPQQVRLGQQLWRFRRDRPGTHGPGSTGAPPRLCVEDAVIDHTNGLDREDVPGVVLAAVQTRRTTAERLLREVHRRPRLRHRRLLMDLLAEVADGVHSPLERVYLHEVERAHGLRGGAGSSVARVVATVTWATRSTAWWWSWTGASTRAPGAGATWSGTTRPRSAASAPCATAGST